MTRTSLLRLAAGNLLAAVFCALLAKACLALLVTAGAGVSPLWLPSGLALALLVVFGPGLLPGLWIGYVAGSDWFGALPYASATIGAASMGIAWLGARAFRRWLPGGLTDTPQAPARFLAIAYGCGALAGLAGPLVLWVFGVLPVGRFDTTVIVWWLGDALGIVALAPAVLAVREAAAGERWPLQCGTADALVAAGTLTLALLTFVADVIVLPSAHLQAALLLPPLMWLTMRCHPAVPLALNLAAVVGLVHGAGGSLGPQLGPTPDARAVTLHGFILIPSVTLLFLGAHMHRVRALVTATRASEERFRRLTALTSDWYWEQDADFRFTRFEGPVFGDLASQPPLMVGKRRWELPGVEPYSISWDAHRADLEEHRSFVSLTLRYTSPDGRVAYYNTSGEPVFDAAGKFVGYRGVGRVVTPEVESREALLASERQFHDVADATFESLFIHDYGRIVFANKAFAEGAGCAVEDIIGRPALDFVAPEEHAKVIAQMTSDMPFRHYETVGLRADGGRAPIEVFGRPITFQGRPMRIVAIRDISDRRAIEAALSAQVAFQRTLLETLPNPVFYKDRFGRFLGYNRAFCDFMGIGPHDYIGKSVLDLVPGEMGRQFKANDDALFAAPGIQAYEEPVRGRDGMHYMMVYKDVFRDERGEVGGLIGVLVDITERKKVEDRLRRFQELSPAAIGIIDASGKVLYINPAARDLFGFSIADVPTIEAWWELAYPDPAYRADRHAAWVAAVDQALREGRSMLRFDGRVRCMDGRDRWIETLASLGEQEIFMIFTDLTDYVAAAAR